MDACRESCVSRERESEGEGRDRSERERQFLHRRSLRGASLFLSQSGSLSAFMHIIAREYN